jgi:hypothetical protein
MSVKKTQATPKRMSRVEEEPVVKGYDFEKMIQEAMEKYGE